MGADVGSPAFFNAKIIERSRPGAEINYISSGGGQKRFTQLLGGHLDAAIFSLGEFTGYRASEGTPPDQNIKAIAVLDAERVVSILIFQRLPSKGFRSPLGMPTIGWLQKARPRQSSTS